MEEQFIRRAIELVKEIELISKEDEVKKKLSQLEGYLTGALEIFALASKIADEK